MFGIKTKIKNRLKQYINDRINEKVITSSNGVNSDEFAVNLQQQYVNEFYSSWNIKNIMANLARERVENYIKKLPLPENPEIKGLTSKITTQEDMESSWCRYWLSQLKLDFHYHRKLWEYAFVLQVLYENDMFGKEGLGLACGHELLPSFLISRGCKITAGDKPLTSGDNFQDEWKKSGQYSENADALYKPEYLSKEQFDLGLKFKFIDMNNLPKDEDGKFDFVWSICAVEHLGSIKAGLDFLINSISLLKPGGISIHTLEYNVFSNELTFENDTLAFFRKSDLDFLDNEIKNIGSARFFSFDDNFGFNTFDNYIDMMPYSAEWNTVMPQSDKLIEMDPYIPHLRLLCCGFPITCAAIIIQKEN